MWLLTSEEFIKESNHNKTGKNSRKRSIWINRKKIKYFTEHCKLKYEKYLISDFECFKS